MSESSDKNQQNNKEEKRTGTDRRKFAFGYKGKERRSGEDRREKKDSD